MDAESESGFELKSCVYGSFLSTIFLLFTLLLLSGCNSTWFYRPSDKIYKPFEKISSNKPFMLKSYSGNELHTLLIPALDSSKKTLFVHFHGNAGNITWTSQRYGWLKYYGYDLLVFDYSGYGFSSGKPSPKATWQDALTVLDYALKQKADRRWDNIVLAGTSLGGNILLHALADYPKKNEFDLVFIDSSFMSYKKVAAGLVKDKPGGSIAEMVANWVISDEYAPSKYGSIELDSNIVVAHCKNDKLIKPDLGEELFASLKSSNKQWFSLKGCSHAQGFREKFVEHRLQLLEAIKI